MGKFRISSRRSFKVMPGVRVNTGKKGFNSISIGGKSGPFRATTNVNLHTGKTRSTYSVKGLGSVSSASNGNAHHQATPPTPPAKRVRPPAKPFFTPARWLAFVTAAILLTYVAILLFGDR